MRESAAIDARCDLTLAPSHTLRVLLFVYGVQFVIQYGSQVPPAQCRSDQSVG